jgi:hypothetical protein
MAVRLVALRDDGIDARFSGAARGGHGARLADHLQTLAVSGLDRGRGVAPEG